MTTIVTTKPTWITKYLVAFATIVFGDKAYTYAILDRKMGPANEMGEMFTIMTDGVIAISDACPWKYRELWIIHEIMENQDECQDHECCLRSLVAELDTAEKQGFNMQEYVKIRIAFFTDVADYYNVRKATPIGKKMYTKISRSLEYLKKLD
jgi:hypothetical protein